MTDLASVVVDEDEKALLMMLDNIRKGIGIGMDDGVVAGARGEMRHAVGPRILPAFPVRATTSVGILRGSVPWVDLRRFLSGHFMVGFNHSRRYRICFFTEKLPRWIPSNLCI